MLRQVSRRHTDATPVARLTRIVDSAFMATDEVPTDGKTGGSERISLWFSK